MSESICSGSPASVLGRSAIEKLHSLVMLLSTLPYMVVEADDDTDPNLLEKVLVDALTDMRSMIDIFQVSEHGNPPGRTPLRMSILEAWKAFSLTATAMSDSVVIPGLTALRTGNFARYLAVLDWRPSMVSRTRPKPPSCTHCSTEALFGRPVYGHEVGDCPFLASEVSQTWDMAPAGATIVDVLSCSLEHKGPIDCSYLLEYLGIPLFQGGED